MTVLDLSDLLDRAQADLGRLHRTWNAQVWQAVRRGSDPDAAVHRANLDRLLGDDGVMMRLEAAYRRDGTDATTKRRAAWWLSCALSHQVARRAGQAGALRQVDALVSSYRGNVGRERPGLDMLRQTLLSDPERSRREQAYLSLEHLARSLEGHGNEILNGLATSWQPKKQQDPGAVSYWRQPLSAFCLDWQDTDIPTLVEEFLSRTEPLLERFHHLAGRTIRSRSLRPWDLEFALHKLAEPYDRHFPPADHTAALSRGLRACGLPTDSLPLTVNLEPAWLPLRHTGWPGVDWLVAVMHRQGAGQSNRVDLAGDIVRLPRPDVGLAVDGRSGPQHVLLALARATGVALGVLHGRAGHLALRQVAGGIDPAASAISAILTEPNYLTGQTQMPRSEVESYLALGCPRSGLLRTMRLRMVAALAMVVWRVFEDAEQDRQALAAHWLRRATGISDNGHLTALDIASLVEPAQWPTTFLAELAGGQLVSHLRKEHGKLMGDRRTAECLIECFWRHGALVPASRALEVATGKGLSVEAEVQALLDASRT